MKIRKTILGLLVLCIAVGCSHRIRSEKLIKLSVDMDKEQVVATIGKPSVLRGSIKNKHGQIIEIWEYRVDKGKNGHQVGSEMILTVFTLGIMSPILLTEGEIENYWLYFCDGTLVKWGQAGDWGREADVIYEVNFNQAPRV